MGGDRDFTQKQNPSSTAVTERELHRVDKEEKVDLGEERALKGKA